MPRRSPPAPPTAAASNGGGGGAGNHTPGRWNGGENDRQRWIRAPGRAGDTPRLNPSATVTGTFSWDIFDLPTAGVYTGSGDVWQLSSTDRVARYAVAGVPELVLRVGTTTYSWNGTQYTNSRDCRSGVSSRCPVNPATIAATISPITATVAEDTAGPVLDPAGSSVSSTAVSAGSSVVVRIPTTDSPSGVATSNVGVTLADPGNDVVTTCDPVARDVSYSNGVLSATVHIPADAPSGTVLSLSNGFVVDNLAHSTPYDADSAVVVTVS